LNAVFCSSCFGSNEVPAPVAVYRRRTPPPTVDNCNNRTQCVVLENCFSTVTDVKSGVVQGSVLGPILFLIFINDVTSVCSNDVKIKLFADDVKLYSIINIANCNIGLQQSLDRLASWAIVPGSLA
jgi:hypothetical protein